jgi:LPS export ABC transporter permease LptG
LPLRILDRYLLTELLEHLLLAVLIFSLIAFFSDLLLDFLQDIQKFGISVQMAFTLIALQFPKSVALVLPAASFLSVLLVFNQLNQTYQVTALRMVGIPLSRLIQPALLLGLLATGATYVLSDYVVPECNRLTQQIKQDALATASIPGGQKSFLLSDTDRVGRLRQLIYVNQFNGTQLGDSTIIDLTRPKLLQIIQAKGGQWFADRWEFERANAYTISTASDVMVFNHLGRVRMGNLIQRGQTEDPNEVRSREESFANLFHKIQQREATGLRVAKSTYVKLWKKLTLPLSCLLIVLAAVPLALTHPRSGSNRGFVFALGVLFAFYMVRAISVSLGDTGALTLGGLLPVPVSGFIAAWLPLVLLAGLGVGLTWQKNRQL